MFKIIIGSYDFTDVIKLELLEFQLDILHFSYHISSILGRIRRERYSLMIHTEINDMVL
jgi:hypothetical protein